MSAFYNLTLLYHSKSITIHFPTTNPFSSGKTDKNVPSSCCKKNEKRYKGNKKPSGEASGNKKEMDLSKGSICQVVDATYPVKQSKSKKDTVHKSLNKHRSSARKHQEH